tara:strand:+ start:28 stop:666 length:639 start_codon:yes stop_codon:yes gene_type:complete
LNKKKYNKIVILGQSQKFIKEIKKNYKYDSLSIIPWRQIGSYSYKKKEIYNLIFLAGFNFGIYTKGSTYFNQKNIYEPLELIEKISNKKTLIIYINTQKMNDRNYTFSRYRYAKQKLGYLIYRKFKNSLIFDSDLIKVTNHISINSNIFSRFIFHIFSMFNLIKTIDIKKIFLEINNMIILKNRLKQRNIKGFFLNISRTQLIDRILRLILG